MTGVLSADMMLSELIEALREFPFSFLGALIGTLALAWTVIKSPRKRLKVEELWAVRVISRYSDVPDSIELDGEELSTDQLFEVVVDVRNNGNQDVETGHFERPLTFYFGEQARVVFALVIDEDPQCIGASLEVRSHEVELVPTLLNAGDIVCLYLLVYCYDDMQAEGRIVGVKRVQRSSVWEGLRRKSIISTVGTFVTLGLILLIGFFPRIMSSAFAAAMLGISAASLVLILWDSFKMIRDHKRVQRREGSLKIKSRSLEEEFVAEAEVQHDVLTEEFEESNGPVKGTVDGTVD